MKLALSLLPLALQHADARIRVNEFGRELETNDFDAFAEEADFWSRALESSLSMSMSTDPESPSSPDGPTSPGIPESSTPDEIVLPDIVTIAASNENFSTLVAAVTAADLVGALSSPGPFTVFAPIDAAFAALPDGLVGCLLADIPTLTAILLYHVVGAKVLSTDLSDGLTATTLGGGDVEVSIGSAGIFINSSEVIAADIEASNGVIHVIDSVLVPPGVDVAGYLESCLATADIESATGSGSEGGSSTTGSSSGEGDSPRGSTSEGDSPEDSAASRELLFVSFLGVVGALLI